MAGGETFIRITNKDIYVKLEHIVDKLDRVQGHVELNKASIKKLWWLFGTATSLAIGVFTSIIVL